MAMEVVSKDEITEEPVADQKLGEAHPNPHPTAVYSTQPKREKMLMITTANMNTSIMNFFFFLTDKVVVLIINKHILPTGLV